MLGKHKGIYFNFDADKLATKTPCSVEFTSGPLGSGNATLLENPERFTGADEGKLWMELDLDNSAAPPGFPYEIWQAGGGLLERHTLSYEEISGRQIALSPPPLLPERMEKKPGR